jgi:aspartate racemase
MRTIGLIGGMSWESSLEYYRVINTEIKRRLGGLHSAQCLMYSVDFAEVEHLQRTGNWDAAAEMMVDAAQRLERGGAGFVVLCTNTMHKLAPAIEAGVRIPLLHIADATAVRIKAQGLHKVGLLGTRFTMEEDFYAGRLAQGHGLEVLIPPAEARQVVHNIIYDELCLGMIKESSRQQLAGIIAGLAEAGAQGIILGCTELELLVQPADSTLPLFPTARIHAEAAVDFALAKSFQPTERMVKGR